MKKNLLWAVLLGCGLVSCNPISGHLKIEKTLTVISEQPQNCNPMGHACPEPKETVHVAPGDYIVNIQFPNKRTAVLALKTASRELSVNLNIPNGRVVPENGSLHLTAQESGQPFDFQALITTTRSDSQRQRTYESCQVSYSETVCVPNGGCTIRTITRWGNRDIEFFDRTTKQTMEASLMDATLKEQLASMDGDRSSVNRIYTYQGQCF